MANPSKHLFLTFLALGYLVSGHTSAGNSAELKTLNSDLQQISTNIYQDIINHPQTVIEQFESLDTLNAEIQSAIKLKQYPRAIGLIQNNLYLLVDSSASIEKVVRFLLHRNYLNTVTELQEVAEIQGNSFVLAVIGLQLAQYYQAMGDWESVQQALATDFAALPLEQAEHAWLLNGIALQKVKQHRQSVPYYKKISPESRYYLSAQLNIATAFVRQGWWSDAQRITNMLRKNKAIKAAPNSIDKLYLFSGYSFLQNGYYRDAREAFRNVEQNSPYKIRALLGLGLTAAFQKDYNSALNAFSLLQAENAKNIDDKLILDEVQLLLPYFNQKLLQHTTASAGYNEAVQYYENKIYKFTILQDASNHGSHDTLLQGKIPSTLSHDLKEIKYLSKFNLNLETQKQLDKLKKRYLQLQSQIQKEIISTHVKRLTHYQNQSKYKLARLYDQNSIAEKQP